MEGFEAAGAIVEKVLPGVSFPVLMNTVLPGLLAGAALYPFATGRLRNFLVLDVEKGWFQLVIAAVLVVTLGSLISALNGQFNDTLSGRTWPAPLRRWGGVRAQKNIYKLYSELNKIDAEKKKSGAAISLEGKKRSVEIWDILRDYPIYINLAPQKTTFEEHAQQTSKSGDRYAEWPTLLGNIIAGYEQYPKLRYGMSSVFFWPRLWFVVEKDQKEEIAKTWAVADGLLNLSAVSFLAGLLWLSAFLGVEAALLGPRWLPIKDSSIGLSAAILGWFGLGYALYRVSLPFHRQNGQIFKSLFDLYRDRLRKMTSLVPHEEALWTATWAYLQNLQIPCPQCGKGGISVYTSKCSKCGSYLPDLVPHLRRSGEFVMPPKTDGAE
jgi:hypothetical protein